MWWRMASRFALKHPFSFIVIVAFNFAFFPILVVIILRTPDRIFEYIREIQFGKLIIVITLGAQAILQHLTQYKDRFLSLATAEYQSRVSKIIRTMSGHYIVSGSGQQAIEMARGVIIQNRFRWPKGVFIPILSHEYLKLSSNPEAKYTEALLIDNLVIVTSKSSQILGAFRDPLGVTLGIIFVRLPRWRHLTESGNGKHQCQETDFRLERVGPDDGAASGEFDDWAAVPAIHGNISDYSVQNACNISSSRVLLNSETENKESQRIVWQFRNQILPRTSLNLNGVDAPTLITVFERELRKNYALRNARGNDAIFVFPGQRIAYSFSQRLIMSIQEVIFQEGRPPRILFLASRKFFRRAVLNLALSLRRNVVPLGNKSGPILVSNFFQDYTLLLTEDDSLLEADPSSKKEVCKINFYPDRSSGSGEHQIMVPAKLSPLSRASILSTLDSLKPDIVAAFFIDPEDLEGAEVVFSLIHCLNQRGLTQPNSKPPKLVMTNSGPIRREIERRLQAADLRFRNSYMDIFPASLVDTDIAFWQLFHAVLNEVDPQSKE